MDLQVSGRELSAEVLAVRNGLVGWSGFNDESGQPIFFCSENIDRIPVRYVDELAQAIFEFSHLNKEEIAELREIVRFSEFMNETKNPEIWDCKWCKENGRQNQRRCENEDIEDHDPTQLKKRLETQSRYGIKRKTPAPDGNPEFVLEYRGHKFPICPLTRKSYPVEMLYGLVVRSDNTSTLPGPGGLLNQDNRFIMAMDIVNSEKGRVDQHKRAEEKGKSRKNKDNNPPPISGGIPRKKLRK